MNTILKEIETNVVEVRGQIEEGGNARDAATDLLDSVQRLIEQLDGR